MRFISAIHEKESFIGYVDETLSYTINLQAAEKVMRGTSKLPTNMVNCIEMGEEFIRLANEIADWALTKRSRDYFYEPADYQLLAPIPRPTKNVFCVGKNYADHAIEMGSAEDIPENIMMFTKAPTTVVGSGATVLNHMDVTNQLDYEGELAVVIGKRGKAIPEEKALEYVFGYTIVNDITARDIQSKHKQFFLGKSLDTTCPMGPFLAYHTLIGNPNNLKIETKVNGEIRQSATTRQFIFPVETIISVISQGMTLEPGDIIATGTPAGVGKGFKPPRYLKQGDKIEVSIEGLGVLVNEIEK
ncbi:fumarylacetoacetate hydrolase family protein [Bacillus timonensis]|nr:fumarylacetoacetate hydrolase family protein [Bacillus timonensis]